MELAKRLARFPLSKQGNMKANPTKVLFRIMQGECLALFPALPGTSDPTTCVCYAHVGQHASADLKGCITRSRPAKVAEYRSLASELKRAGYTLNIRQRCNRDDAISRRMLSL